MGYRDYWSDDRPPGRSHTLGMHEGAFPPILKALIIANVAVWALLALGHRWKWDVWAFEWMAVTADTVFKGQVWRLLTHGFLHAGFWHLLMNMLGLFFLGPMVERRLGSRRFLVLYFGAILVGGLGFCAWTTFEAFSGVPGVGASGAVFAVVVAFAVLEPDAMLMLIFPPIPLKAKWLATGFVVLAMISLVGGQSGSLAESAHLAGALWGWVIVRHGDRFERLLDRMEDKADKRERGRIIRMEQDVDALLDKVNEVGWENLTRSEQRTLEKASRKFKDRDDK